MLGYVIVMLITCYENSLAFVITLKLTNECSKCSRVNTECSREVVGYVGMTHSIKLLERSGLN